MKNSDLQDLHNELKRLEEKYQVIFISSNGYTPMIVENQRDGSAYLFKSNSFEKEA